MSSIALKNLSMYRLKTIHLATLKADEEAGAALSAIFKMSSEVNP
jgi:hypothetical protein